MRLNTIKPGAGSKRTRLRVGRGASAGQGKTCGRGVKGQRARKGGYHKVGFEGGQMPLQRRLPKTGFRSAIKASRAELTLSDLMRVSGADVTLAGLIEANLVPEGTKLVKIILSGSVSKPFTVKDKSVTATKGAKSAVEAAGGKFEAYRKPVATSSTNAAAALGDITRFAEMRKRLVFLLGALIVYRIGTFIPVPGIDAAKFAAFFSTQNGTLLGMFNMFSGGALQRFSIFALNVMPYITASIIVQMASMVYPPWAQIRKDGESGRRKLMQYTRYGTVALAAFQGFGAALAIQNSGGNLVPNPGPQFLFVATVSITTGTLFVMWLGEQITERGIGNGITMIIVAGIIAGLPRAIGNTLEMVRSGEMNPLIVLLILVVVVLVTLFCVFVERALRKIQVNYAKRQVGRRMMQGQSTHLPFKLNMAGVIPPIFASSLLVFPATIAQFFGNSPNPNFIQSGLQRIAAILNYGQPLHVVLFGLLVIGFAFFYVALVYDARDTAENLKKAGAFIPGIRPGLQTGEYLDKVLTRLTLWGGLYIMAVCLLPEIIRMVNPAIPFQFGGTSLLIIVVGVMDFVAQLQSHMMSQQYEGLMKKASLRGIGAKK